MHCVRYLLMKWHVFTLLFFTKIDDFLPFAFLVVKSSLHNKNLCFLLILTSEIRLFLLHYILNNLSVLFLLKSGYYIVPNLSSTLLKFKTIFSNSGHGLFLKSYLLVFNFTFPFWNTLSKMSTLDQNCRGCRDKVCTFMKYRQSY